MTAYVIVLFFLAAAAFGCLAATVSDFGRRIDALEWSDADMLQRIKACSKDLSEAVENIESLQMDGEGLNRRVSNLLYTCSDLETRMDKLETD